MSKQTINIGASPNDGTGTPLRTSFDYTNQNFTELYTALGGGVGLPGATTQVIFNDGGTNLAGDAGLVYNKTTDALTVGGNITSTSGKFATAASGQNVGLQLDSYVSGAAFNNYILNNDSTAGTIAALNFGRNTSLLYGFIRTNNNSQNLQLGTSGAGSVEFFQNNSTAMTLNSTGLGIGMGPANNLSIGSATYASFGVKIDSITQSSLIFRGTPDASGYEHAKIVSGRESPPSTYGSFLAFYTEAKPSGSTDTSVERARFNSTGNLAFANGLGIDFSAVTGGTGTATANVLNDYEEGTWVGTLKGSVSDPTVAVTATGKYTKVGRQVTVSIYYNNVSTVGASGNVTIDGLPFTGSESFAGSSITFGLFTTSTTLACWNVSTSIAFYITGNFVQATHSPGTGKYLTTTITYFV